ncbi:MAG: tRNA uridine-5-carboxymethylaminomethyl(34) synthesis GTPase MnmE [Desulfobacteraceae bacterium 4484_190.3]|nr:MAG: tRNA uridine-5-carboxymethylaminomethyl(34) synthesis GTPase MnmE [Desulfobacteraceae bacterium 4484_190.3]
MKLLQKDTIAAIATPCGVGGIGIIRISGSDSEEIGRLLFKSKKSISSFKSHYLYSGNIVSPTTGAILDEVLLSVMRKPHSYTGEDVLEINCHGGPVVLEAVLSEVIEAGARLAEPGEFTRRAFMNNRLDLSQAEAVIDLIMAKTDRGLNLALSHLKGDLSKKINDLRSSIIDLLSIVEISIDFTEEDIHTSPVSELSDSIQHIITSIDEILSTYGEGKILREGLSVVITGKPNVGKSSLLNRLLNENRAIVTSVPGTTRDFIEEVINIKGIPVKFIDTAGIRDVENVIEQEGIRLVWEKVSSSDIVVILLDGSKNLTEEDMEVIEKNKNGEIILAVNKNDLPPTLRNNALSKILPGVKPLWISAKYGDGIPALKEEIYARTLQNGQKDIQSNVILTNLRHKIALEKAGELLAKAKRNIIREISPELAAFDMREALKSLGEIVGETTNEDVLDKIFANFCIGK